MNNLRKVLGNTGVSFFGQIITWISTLALTAAYGRFLGDERAGAERRPDRGVSQ